MEMEARHYDKIIITLFMCLAILFMATFSPFADSTKAIAVVDDAIIAIIIAGLAAIGITFVTSSSYSNLNDYVTSLLEQYALDHNTTVDILLKGTQSGTDKLGRLLINNRFVILIDSFAKWITAHFSLADNNRYDVVIPGVALGNLHGYSLPVTFISDDSTWVFTIEDQDATDDVAIFFQKPSGSGSWSVRGITRGTAKIKGIEIASNGTTFTNTVNLDATLNGWHWNYPQAFYISTSRYDDANVLYGYYESEIRTALYTYDSLTNTPYGIIINTGDITYPTDNENYVDGDGAIIDVDADWGLSYSDVTEQVIPDGFSDSKEGEASIEYVTEEEVAEAVEDTSEITNLPAGAIPFVPLALPQFNLISIWHYVQQWISDTAIAASSLMSIATLAPNPMVNLFYALVCLAIIFGFIKGLAK